jgi:hypothetical protein
VRDMPPEMSSKGGKLSSMVHRQKDDDNDHRKGSSFMKLFYAKLFQPIIVQ